MTIEQLFDTLPQRFRAKYAPTKTIHYHFDFLTAQFTVTLSPLGCVVAKGLINTPSCTINTDTDTYIRIETGQLPPYDALLSGKVKVDNLEAMMLLGKCFQTLSIPTPTTPFPLQRNISKGILKDIRVLDLTRLLPGPMASMFLADMGADVLKIEHPDTPDNTRQFPPFNHTGQAAYYTALNRSKRSITLDLQSDEGKTTFCKLLANTDILLESYRPGVMQKLGLDYQNLSQQYPRLIYVSITGYGQHSPYANHAGHDLNYLALSGILSLNKSADGTPIIPAVQFADVAAGAYMTLNACLLALWQREKTGTGDHADISMLDCLVPILSLPFAEFQATQQVPQNGQYFLSGALPNYNVYQCSDGLWVALGALEPKFWANFCQLVQKNQWKSPILPQTKEAQERIEQVKTLFKTKTRAEWLALAQQTDICLSPVYELNELQQDPHFAQTGLIIEHQHPIYGKAFGLKNPLRFENANTNKGWAAPMLGEDNK